jgi:hypothetical protein
MMPDSDEKKVAVDILRTRMNRVGQKPEITIGKGAKTTSSTSAIRLDHSRLMKIEGDSSIIDQVAMADVITARTHSNEREECIYRRPKAELEVPGLPYNIQTLQFSVPNVKDLRFLIQVIGRMKQKV